jgi:hypothetical protein
MKESPQSNKPARGNRSRKMTAYLAVVGAVAGMAALAGCTPGGQSADRKPSASAAPHTPSKEPVAPLEYEVTQAASTTNAGNNSLRLKIGEHFLVLCVQPNNDLMLPEITGLGNNNHSLFPAGRAIPVGASAPPCPSSE